MAAVVFNVASGEVNAYARRVATNDPVDSAILVVLLKEAVTDAALRDFNTLAALLADAGNTEADFTNYARKVLTDANIVAPTPDHVNNWQSSDAPDQTFASAGGVLNNTLVKALFCYRAQPADPDSAIIPLTFHDYAATTDGNDLVMRVSTSGFYRSVPA